MQSRMYITKNDTDSNIGQDNALQNEYLGISHKLPFSGVLLCSNRNRNKYPPN